MTNEAVFKWAFILSVITVIVYLLCKRSKSKLDEAIVIFLSCSGVLTGIQIFSLITDSKIDLGQLKEYRLYLAVGALSVIWLSVTTMIKCFRNN